MSELILFDTNFDSSQMSDSNQNLGGNPGKIFEEEIDYQMNFDPSLQKVTQQQPSQEAELLKKLDELNLKLRDKDKKLATVQKEFTEHKSTRDKVQYLYTKVYTHQVEAVKESEDLQKENETLKQRNQEIKNMFKTLKEGAVGYKSKTKQKMIDLKKTIETLQRANKTTESESDLYNKFESKLYEDSSANINELMRQSREKEIDFSSQIKDKSKQLEDLQNSNLNQKSLQHKTLVELDSTKQTLSKTEYENQQVLKDIASMRKDFDSLEHKYKNEIAHKDIVIQKKESALETEASQLKLIQENRVIDIQNKLSQAETENNKLKRDIEVKERGIEELKRQVLNEEQNNNDQRETIQKLHTKYKGIIENIAHEAGKFKTESFINKTLLEDKTNELEMCNQELGTIKMVSMNKNNLVNRAAHGDVENYGKLQGGMETNSTMNNSRDSKFDSKFLKMKEIENKFATNDILADYDNQLSQKDFNMRTMLLKEKEKDSTLDLKQQANSKNSTSKFDPPESKFSLNNLNSVHSQEKIKVNQDPLYNIKSSKNQHENDEILIEKSQEFVETINTAKMSNRSNDLSADGQFDQIVHSRIDDSEKRSVISDTSDRSGPRSEPKSGKSKSKAQLKNHRLKKVQFDESLSASYNPNDELVQSNPQAINKRKKLSNERPKVESKQLDSKNNFNLNSASPRVTGEKAEKQKLQGELGKDNITSSSGIQQSTKGNIKHPNMFNSQKVIEDKLTASNEDLSRNVFSSSQKSEIEEDIDYTNF